MENNQNNPTLDIKARIDKLMDGDGATKAYASVTIGGAFAVHDIRITERANKVTGKLAFNDGTDISGTGNGYVKLNAYVYEALDPNGAKVFFSFPLVSTMTRITVTQAAVPTATPGAGQVALGTTVKLATTTPGARIFYTLDDTAPDMSSMEYTGTPITIQGATKIRAIAIKDGMDPSTELDADYTIQ